MMRICIYCDKEISERMLDIHVIACYCLYCDRNSIIRLCTCISCHGKRAHPSATPIFHNTISQLQQPSFSLSSTPSTQELPPTSSQPTPTSTTPQKTREEGLRIIGKKCCVCNKITQTSPLPIITIGDYHSVLICKIQHLNSEDEINQVYNFIEDLYNKVIQGQLTNGFRLVDRLELTNSNNNNNNGTNNNNLICDGIDKIYSKTNKVKCTNQINTDESKQISIQEKTGKAKFCSVAHLLKYISSYYSSGMKTSLTKKNNAKNKRKRQDSENESDQDEEDEEDEEDGEDEDEEDEDNDSPPPPPQPTSKKGTKKPAAPAFKKESGIYNYINRYNLFNDIIGIPKDVFHIIAEKRKNTIKKQTKLLVEDLILLTFLYLRHYPVMILLSVMFQIPLKSAYRYKDSTQSFLYDLFLPEISMLDPLTRSREGGELLRYPTLPYTLILDGTEQPCDSSSNPMVEPGFYSAKKKQHSVNIVIGCNRFGRVLYLSGSYPGGTNDLQIVKTEQHLWLDILTPFEYVLGDQGFNGNINILTFSKHGKIGHHFSKHRTKVENVIGDLKNRFACLRETQRMNINKPFFLIDHQQRWVICCGLRNRYLLS